TGMMAGGAMASAQNFLNWLGQRTARVMYLNGEMPQETFQQRMRMVTSRYGEGIPFYGYNWEALGPDGIPPLNTPIGQAWLRREIEAVLRSSTISCPCFLDLWPRRSHGHRCEALSASLRRDGSRNGGLATRTTQAKALAPRP